MALLDHHIIGWSGWPLRSGWRSECRHWLAWWCHVGMPALHQQGSRRDGAPTSPHHAVIHYIAAAMLQTLVEPFKGSPDGLKNNTWCHIFITGQNKTYTIVYTVWACIKRTQLHVTGTVFACISLVVNIIYPPADPQDNQCLLAEE